MKTKQEILDCLGNFYGTEQYYKYGNSILTDGAFFIANSCESFWLMDLICSYQIHNKFKKEYFQVFNLKRIDEDSFRVTMEDGNNKQLGFQDITYSDFPLDSITLWRVDGVIMLPSEY